MMSWQTVRAMNQNCCRIITWMIAAILPSIGTTTILDDGDDDDGVDGDDVAVLPENIPRKVTAVPKPPE
jgi:hypothetical protein